jgi:hypothetical protein
MAGLNPFEKATPVSFNALQCLFTISSDWQGNMTRHTSVFLLEKNYAGNKKPRKTKEAYKTHY